MSPSQGALDLEARLQGRLRAVEERLGEACARAGRSPAEVRVLPVTKTVGPEVVEALFRLGRKEVGESRVHQALQKAATVSTATKWHLIGHLQRRKVKEGARLFCCYHSLDSLRLADELEKRLAVLEADSASGSGVLRLPLPVYLEVNVSGEEQKHGFRPEEVEGALARLARLSRLQVVGLMTMAPVVNEAEQARPVFAGLRELRERANDRGWYRERLAGLSMGMTQDFEVAVEEGATLLRLGSAIVGVE